MKNDQRRQAEGLQLPPWIIYVITLGFLSLGRLQAANEDASKYKLETDIAYYSDEQLAKSDDYVRSQCKLDLYYPTGKTGFATVIWFHGGGLTNGKKSIPSGFKNRGYAVIGVEYRFAPPGKFPCFLEDGAAATAWVFHNMGSRGGDAKKVFISGHSAGGYLAAMIAMDPRWLKPYGLSGANFAGVIPISGQMTAHFQVRKLMGDESPALKPVINEFAPLYYASADLPPICLIVGDRALEFKSRVEENALMAITLKNLGHKHVEYYEMGGMDHGGMSEGGVLVARKFVDSIFKAKP